MSIHKKGCAAHANSAPNITVAVGALTISITPITMRKIPHAVQHFPSVFMIASDKAWRGPRKEEKGRSRKTSQPSSRSLGISVFLFFPGIAEGVNLPSHRSLTCQNRVCYWDFPVWNALV